MSEMLVAGRLEEWLDPDAVYRGWAARHEESFWLDAGPGAVAGWSWVGIGARESDLSCLRSIDCSVAPSAGHAGAFVGGWVGWLGYDSAAARAGAPGSEDRTGVPEEHWVRVERFVAFEHSSGVAWAYADPDDLDAFLRELRLITDTPPDVLPAAAAAATSRHTPTEYATLIERCRAAIAEGDAYQLCLTTRFEVAASGSPIDPVATYARLRAATPAHHGGLVVSGSVALASASPERFLAVERGRVQTRPIKGTRPRGADADTDADLIDDLRSSEKERAENVMIVDLMRNDLSRVCAPGSVGVDRLLEVETYPAVHQLVSTVSGELTQGMTVGGLLDATFPAGSMTGAPKLSAMTILHDLEGDARGIFSGCFGWVGTNGALDLAMVIRSIVVHEGDAYVGAGGGITWKSDAAAEVAEVAVKARAPLAALGASLPPGW
ncbi:aminodeoxychorismate synthase component I [Microbacterium lacus]|uniref:aminodeoxychorismate synthase component I n=1 Tax=Microbacterium lacus TaxID=415217 RepID=UPI00384CE1E1